MGEPQLGGMYEMVPADGSATNTPPAESTSISLGFKNSPHKVVEVTDPELVSVVSLKTREF